MSGQMNSQTKIPTSGFLTSIRESTQVRIAERCARRSLGELLREARAARPTLDFAAALKSGAKPRVIAEIKRRSPSRGAIAPTLHPVEVAAAYQQAGAAAVSVLTEPLHFGGKVEDLADVRATQAHLPLLLKDFVIDEYQVAEARTYGADAVLLIVALLGAARLAELHAMARELDLTPLVEVHDELELAIAGQVGAKVIGINNRNLNTLQISLDVSRRLISSAPADAVMVCESGIEDAASIREFSAGGFDAFLIGTSLMRGGTPGTALAELLKDCR